MPVPTNAPQMVETPRPIRLARLIVSRLKLYPPIDVLTVIAAYGIRLREASIDENLDGFLVYHPGKDRFGIVTNSRFRHPYRRRFTLAHELGHYVLHRHIVRAAGHTGVLYSPELEGEANQFASELLMPASEVRLARSVVTEPDRYFRVSQAAWLRRISDLSAGSQ